MYVCVCILRLVLPDCQFPDVYMHVLLFRLVLPDGVSQFPLCVTHVCWPHGGLLVFCIHGKAGIFLSAVHLPQDSSEEILQLG